MSKPLMILISGPYMSGTNGDAVLRIPGESRGADLEMAKAKDLGKIIFNSFEEIPNLNSEI